MTSGEKMIWAAVYAQTLSYYQGKLDKRAATNIAASMATDAVVNLRDARDSGQLDEPLPVVVTNMIDGP